MGRKKAVVKPLQNSTPALSTQELAVALTLTNQSTPTATAFATALQVMYPAENGPTLKDVLASGQLVYTTDGQRLRVPPLAPDEPEQPLNTPPLAAEPAMAPRAAGLFSFYEGGIGNTTPTTVLTLADLHAVLVSPRYSARTKALREATDIQARKTIKKTLDYVTPAGVFSHRANAGVRSISGLLVLDFDHMPDVDAARAALLADALLAPGLALMFTSPSGNGLKVIFWTDPEADHLGNFRGYADYLKAHYAHLGLVPDEAGKDLARACFVPHDPAAWLAPTTDDSAAA